MGKTSPLKNREASQKIPLKIIERKEFTRHLRSEDRRAF